MMSTQKGFIYVIDGCAASAKQNGQKRKYTRVRRSKIKKLHILNTYHKVNQCCWLEVFVCA